MNYFIVLKANVFQCQIKIEKKFRETKEKVNKNKTLKQTVTISLKKENL